MIYDGLPDKLKRYVEGCDTAKLHDNKRRKLTEAIVSWGFFWDKVKTQQAKEDAKARAAIKVKEAAEYAAWEDRQKATEAYTTEFIKNEAAIHRVLQQQATRLVRQPSSELGEA